VTVLATLVEGQALLETVIASVVLGVGVTLAFSVAIWGFGRSAELGREDRPLAAASSAAVGALGLLVVLGAVVAGILAMASK
jgi:uncharacterized membrane protein YidH (DUF202 family)